MTAKASMPKSDTPTDVSMQATLLALQRYWTDHGCVLGMPSNTEVGAGTANPNTLLRVLGPEPWRAAYVEPSVRPDDSRYGDNPNRLQTHTQFQVLLKPEPGNAQELYLGSLRALGIDIHANDVRFVEDDWSSPALGAWGQGWEVWLNGMEISQFTYFQQAGGIPLDPVSVEITYGIERILMALQQVDHFADIEYAPGVKYGEIIMQSEKEMSRYYLDVADVDLHREAFTRNAAEAARLVDLRLPLPAHGFVLRCSHSFNILDARGAVSTTERAEAFRVMRSLTRDVARLWADRRHELAYPLGSTPAPRAVGTKVEYLDSTWPEWSIGKRDAVLEVGVEELPALEVAAVANRTQAWLEARLDESGLQHEGVAVSATPRRIVAVIRQVDAYEKPESKSLRGPRTDRAYESDGSPSPALRGFLSSNQLELTDVTVRTVDDRSYIFADRKTLGRPSIEVLATVFEEIVTTLRAASNIRWNDPHLTYARPIRWLLALAGEDVVPVRASGLTAGRRSHGLRTDHDPSFDVPSAAMFPALLHARDIVLDQGARRASIVEAAIRLAGLVGGWIDERADAGLIDEIANLVESPTVMVGRFDERFLSLPDDVLTTVMVKHQRYIPIRGTDGLVNAFVIVANGPCNEAAVVRGNETVITARFEDATFFWTSDLRLSPASMRASLHSLLFEDTLGSMADRASRIDRLARTIAQRANPDEETKDTLARAGALAKFDLASSMVIELPSLAGDMAAHYARRSGESPQVADALQQMERPRATGDRLPSTFVGAVLSLADRVDALVGLHAVGKTATGSSDPFALRRRANGVAAVLSGEADLRTLRVGELVDAAVGVIEQSGIDVPPTTSDTVKSLLLDRLGRQLEDHGVRLKVVRAVRGWLDSAFDASRVSSSLEKLLDDRSFQGTVESLQRAQRLVASTHFSEHQLIPASDEEAQLLRVVEHIEEFSPGWDRFEALISCHDEVRRAITDLFDGVLVMHEAPAVRAGRLTLLARTVAAGGPIDWNSL